MNKQYRVNLPLTIEFYGRHLKNCVLPTGCHWKLSQFFLHCCQSSIKVHVWGNLWKQCKKKRKFWSIWVQVWGMQGLGPLLTLPTPFVATVKKERSGCRRHFIFGGKLFSVKFIYYFQFKRFHYWNKAAPLVSNGWKKHCNEWQCSIIKALGS